MKILLINAVCGITSTGKIAAAIAEKYEKEGHTVKIGYGRDGFVPDQFKKYAVRIGNNRTVRAHAILTRLTDRHGFFSSKATRKFLKWADEFDPDVLWLHNLHGYYINIDLLFGWIKSRPQMQVKWTLHDCWAFTGHCANFTMARCDKWKTGCHHCPQLKEYPASFFADQSKRNYEDKKKLFTGVPSMTLITPSGWLKDLVKESFLKEYPAEVVHNKINTDIFKPTPGNFRKKYQLEDQKIILGVSNVWTRQKGFDDFIRLAHKIPPSFKIVLVGVRPDQMKNLPSSILALERTHNPQELAEIYTASDVLFNPTYEDNYPTVNLEARACHLPIVCYNTGGCPETLGDKDKLTEPGDLEGAYQLLCDTIGE